MIIEAKEQFAVFEKVPAHGSEVNGIILGPFNTKEEAIEKRIEYGYTSDNYYVDKIKTMQYGVSQLNVVLENLKGIREFLSTYSAPPNENGWSLSNLSAHFWETLGECIDDLEEHINQVK
jgi:hypothetical protein